MRRPAAARNPLLTLLFALCVLGAAGAGAQEPDENGEPRQREFCEAWTNGETAYCKIESGQTIGDAYRYGQAIYIECGRVRYRGDDKPFACPRNEDVDVKVTVIKSVKKALGLSSTTISARKAIGPLTIKLEGDEEKAPYYFVPLRAEVERKMKAKKVSSITVTASGTATGRNGKVHRFPRTRSEWDFPGNCQGTSLRIQRHLTYGGTCYRH